MSIREPSTSGPSGLSWKIRKNDEQIPGHNAVVWVLVDIQITVSLRVAWYFRGFALSMD